MTRNQPSWNWTRCGHSFCGASTNVGCGSRCAVRHGKSWLMSSATAASKLVASSGQQSRRPIKQVIATRISGKLTTRSFLTSNTRPVARIPGRRLMSSDGTTPCVSGWVASYARVCRFLNLRRCMRFVCDCFYIVTISRLSHPVEPLPKIDPRQIELMAIE